MKFRLLTFVVSLLLMTNFLQAQESLVKGTVKENGTGEPLPGVNVLIKGTSVGTTTDFNGEFALSVEKGGTLVFSYIGFVSKEVLVENQSTFDISLDVDAEQLEEVVVTALGVERSAESLTYSTQSVSSEDLITAKDPNVMNSLSGRVAGLQLSRSGSGAGGSVKINLRGNRSVSGSSSPLYVIDGVPMAGQGAAQPGEIENPSRDGGDGISNINPEDIESINVLKGAAASALYGSQAANGVIMITTKKGEAGQSRVSFSSNFMAEQAYLYPEMQSKYDAEGNAINHKAHTSDDFYETGTTWVNSLSYSQGGDNSQFYASYANTNAQGVMPTNTFNKHNFSFNTTTKSRNDKLEMRFSANYITQEGFNRPSAGAYMNPIYSSYLSSRSISQDELKNNYQTWNKTRQIYEQNYAAPVRSEIANENPYWLLDKATSEDIRNRYMLSGSLSYKFNENFSIQGRANIDATDDVWERKAHATTNPINISVDPGTGLSHGGYFKDEFSNTMTYADAILNYNKKINDFNITALVGGAIRDEKNSLYRVTSDKRSIKYTNIFTVASLPEGMVPREAATQRQVQSVFASASLGYKEMVYLDVTGRNDWSSTLPVGDNSFFYPSVGLTAVLNNMFDLPEVISLAKVRGNYTVLGNDANAGLTILQHGINFNGDLAYSDISPADNLKPELSTSIEFGAELELFNGLLYLDANFYKTNTVNQLFRVDNRLGTSNFNKRYVNAGDVENRGFELSISAMPVSQGDLTWSTTLNLSRNVNEIKELYTRDNGTEAEFDIVTNGGNINYMQVLRKGGAIGEIWTADFARNEDGTIIVDDNGVPSAAGITPEESIKSNSNPDFIAGWANTLKYKGFTLNMVIDGKFGGQTLSLTDSYMDAEGTSVAYAEAVENDGSVEVEGISFDPVKYLNATSGRAGVTSQYLYDQTNIRLRELSIGYTFNNVGPLSDVTLSAVGRNLFFFYNAAPFDPDVVMSTGVGVQGLNFFSLPTTRSVGLNLRVNF
ncbi:TonB-dependent receptor [Flammeovirga sp. EKP202]|uniref:TonB-dependent receptor domain-containing protein n=1 Tax=Flammeovirga sp. EKP202 TaxID=2770592 RepID=UPI00165F5B64|nr:TonB-dependent receptor [Flammeovirga sp. EKP202]MBD0401608.1 TonB-dependent receptor [Flammeovirga sp. EKP202]